MSRMSARFIAQQLIGFTTKDVYEMWNDMGIVKKDKLGDWVLTELGRALGGRVSQGNHPVPTFKADEIIDKMIEFYNKNHK